jgi:hypothetical protein
MVHTKENVRMPDFEIDVPAYPISHNEDERRYDFGMSIRQVATLMAMQGMLANGAYKEMTPERMAEIAHDAAIAALRKST